MTGNPLLEESLEQSLTIELLNTLPSSPRTREDSCTFKECFTHENLGENSPLSKAIEMLDRALQEPTRYLVDFPHFREGFHFESALKAYEEGKEKLKVGKLAPILFVHDIVA